MTEMPIVLSKCGEVNPALVLVIEQVIVAVQHVLASKIGVAVTYPLIFHPINSGGLEVGTLREVFVVVSVQNKLIGKRVELTRICFGSRRFVC